LETTGRQYFDSTALETLRKVMPEEAGCLAPQLQPL
jgi:hypothetical protein